MEPIKLTKIDESLLSAHSCLEPSDRCYFLGEYASRRGFNHSEMNQVINNFKKPMDRKELREWHYKEQALIRIAFWLASTSGWAQLKNYTWVPMPPSKAKTDPKYDDRLWRVLQKMKEIEPALDIRELLLAKTSREAAHDPGAKRPKVKDHLNNFIIDEALKNSKPRAIAIFDDLITSGAHFKAAQIILQKEFPDVPVAGIFVARSVTLPDDETPKEQAGSKS